METLLYLEKEFGNLDDLDIDISTKSKEELTSIIKYIQINLYDNSITIGDNNKIKKSNITTNKWTSIERLKTLNPFKKK